MEGRSHTGEGGGFKSKTFGFLRGKSAKKNRIACTPTENTGEANQEEVKEKKPSRLRKAWQRAKKPFVNIKQRFGKKKDEKELEHGGELPSEPAFDAKVCL